ncbi:DUF3181 family protein [Prochlorothrix hollandica]|uniref:Thylakoid-associated protein n=1 Tax=Prochlorothrix hollandica PCC 9006 = CALU 1027 TaxID=317619 RepID=A0A0M2PV10_PROHO|nr:DUF3181 family protein [Prochlorothrix hollandica]KKI98927.1 thylakoid-associated protein [Prochlorothrix hollandica PCC 9006 = CALU 1027]
MTLSASSQEIEKLAAVIGESAYVDVAKWHLYLNDAKLHVPLAEQVYPLLQDDRLTLEALRSLLSHYLVPLGGGQRQIPLLDLIPSSCLSQLYAALGDYQHQR